MHAHSCGRNHQPTSRSIGFRSGIREVLCDLRQWRYPPEFRIAARPVVAPAAHPEPHLEPPAGPDADLPTTDSAERPDQTARLDRSIAKVAVCLWEIRRKLEASDTAQQDRKLRLLNRRAEAAVTALEDVGVEIDDPIGRRYVPGSEASMTPHFEPTPGTTTEQIVQTIAPVVYRDKRLIGQGEVFVAIPSAAHATANDADMTAGSNDARD